MDKTLTKWTHLLTTNKPTKNWSVTRRQHFNVNQTANYLHSKSPTLSPLNDTGDWCAQYRNQRNSTDYRNCTNPHIPTMQVTFSLVVLVLWVLYVPTLQIPDDYTANPLLTNLDVNYNPLKTLLTASRRYIYLTTANLCLLIWNDCSPVFHFNWFYSALRPLSNNLLLHYRYRLKTSWTYLNLCLTSTYFQ